MFYYVPCSLTNHVVVIQTDLPYFFFLLVTFQSIKLCKNICLLRRIRTKYLDFRVFLLLLLFDKIYVLLIEIKQFIFIQSKFKKNDVIIIITRRTIVVNIRNHIQIQQLYGFFLGVELVQKCFVFKVNIRIKNNKLIKKKQR